MSEFNLSEKIEKYQKEEIELAIEKALQLQKSQDADLIKDLSNNLMNAVLEVDKQKSQDLKLFEDFVEKLKYKCCPMCGKNDCNCDEIAFTFNMIKERIQTFSQELLSNMNQQDCKGGQTISDNVGSSRNSINGKVLTTSESRAKDLLATSERSNEKSVSNMETTGDVRLKPAEDVSLLNGGTSRSSKSPADNYQETANNLSPDNSQNLNQEEKK